MPVAFTKVQAAKLLNAGEMKLFEESRVRVLRTFSASQLDRRVTRMRDLRDRARDLLQRQRVAMREQTGSKRGERGTADQQRSKDKVALMADMLKRFEGQLKIARKLEASDTPMKAHPQRRVTRKAAKTRRTAPDGDFTAARMRGRKRDEEEAAEVMRERSAATRKTTAKKTVTKKAAAKRTVAGKTAAKKAPARKAAKSTHDAPAAPRLDGDTSGKRTSNWKALNDARQTVAGGFANARSHNTAQQRKFQDALVTPIHAHISSRGRRNQGKRDGRG